jgi:nucleotide-binding universal stress UspA family protein
MIDEVTGQKRPMKDRPRKMVVVVDDTPESKIATRFAAGRAGHIEGGGLILFHCIRPSEFQHWIAVADTMLDEAYEAGGELLSEIAERVFTYSGVVSEIVIVDGEPQEQLMKFMEERDDLFSITLGASNVGDPGPLIDYFSGEVAGSLKVPIIIVPGGMTLDQVDDIV